jgi:AAA domain (dynein-related subfamily)
MSIRQKVSWDQAVALGVAATKAGIAFGLEGSPGVGKTAFASEVAKLTQLELATCIGSQQDPTDVAGMPYLTGGEVLRQHDGPIRAACERACLLFLDEFTCTPSAVRASMLRLALERVAGNRALHPATRIMAAWNKPDEAPNGQPLSAADLGRFAIYEFQPTVAEVARYFAGIADPEWEHEAHDFAATLAVSPELVDLSPSQAVIDGGESWAAPRAWERALKHAAFLGSQDLNFVASCMAGSVGERAAIAFSAIRKLREHLPSADAIYADPAGTVVPDRVDLQIAAVGLVQAVAKQCKGAAWIYAGRLKPEIGAAMAQILINLKGPTTPKWSKDGNKAQIALMSKLHQAVK